VKGTAALLQFDGFHLKHNNVINFLHGISGSVKEGENCVQTNKLQIHCVT